LVGGIGFEPMTPCV